MAQRKRQGMKRQTLVAALLFTVFLIAHDCMADTREVDAYLALSPRQQADFEECKAFCLLQHFVSGLREFSDFRIGSGVNEVRLVLRQMGCDGRGFPFAPDRKS